MEPFVPLVGLEPTKSLQKTDYESVAITISAHSGIFISNEEGLRTLKTYFLRIGCLPITSLRHLSGRGDSNPYALLHWLLRPACLPIPPPPAVLYLRSDSNRHATVTSPRFLKP